MHDPVYVASMRRDVAEQFFRHANRRVKVLQSTDALRGVEGAGKTLYFMSHTFAADRPLAIAMYQLALTRRFDKVEFV